jgi:hypothetical protein
MFSNFSHYYLYLFFQLTKMSFMLVLTFVICWAPMQFLNLYRFISNNLSTWPYLAEIFFVCHLLAVSSSYIIPFIYSFTNIRFRKGFLYFLCCKILHKNSLNNESVLDSEFQRLTYSQFHTCGSIISRGGGSLRTASIRVNVCNNSINNNNNNRRFNI